MNRLAAALPVLLCSLVSAQTANTAPPPAVIQMPSDRAQDSYDLYSHLIPLGETAGPGWPHELWLVQDTTTNVVAANEPCSPTPQAGADRNFDIGMNPHAAIRPTADRQQDFVEIMKDFDAHCHDQIKLKPDAWKLDSPVHLLTPAQQDEFRRTRSGRDKAAPEIAAKYRGAPALYAFSEVYFNEHHTVAMIYATDWCGSLCGQGYWLAFAKENGRWKGLNWSSASWIS